MKLHAVWSCPPLQPWSCAQKQVAWAESGTATVPLVAMQRRSEAASAAPNAQQQPHADWSRMSPITLAHLGQLVSLSNASGMATRPRDEDGFHTSMVPFATASWSACLLEAWTPHSDLEAPIGCPFGSEYGGGGGACGEGFVLGESILGVGRREGSTQLESYLEL